MKLKSSLVVLLLVMLWPNTDAHTQEKGNIRGKVIDRITKQALVGANVTVMGTNFGDATNEEGLFLIEGLPEDLYKLNIVYIGYQGYT